MGNQISNVLPSMVLPVERYLQEWPDYRHEKSLGSTRFMKVAAAIHVEGPCVIKVVALVDSSLFLKPYKDQVERITNRLQDALNCCPFTQAMVTEKGGFLIRPFGKDTLYDRLSTRPFLVPVEKLWIAFQLLKSLEQCEEGRVCHGDIKSENVLISSCNWAQLTDFASFKPTYIPHDNPADFSFFFDTGRRRTCYVAPERFLSTTELNTLQQGNTNTTSTSSSSASTLVVLPEDAANNEPVIPSLPLRHPMDVFSMGCVLVEMMTDGCAPFDFSQMLLFRQGKYSPASLIDRIDCPYFREMISGMLQRDPSKRKLASQYLKEQRAKAFPEIFYSFLWPYFAEFVKHPLKNYEERIRKLKDDLPHIMSRVSSCGPSDNDNAFIIVLSLVTSYMRSVKFCRQKLDSVHILEKLAGSLPSEVILDRVLPYLLYMIDDPAANVRAAVVCGITDSLKYVTAVQRSDLRLFSEYVLPKLGVLVTDPSSLVRLTFAQKISSLADTSLRFVEFAGQNVVADPQVQADDSQENKENGLKADLFEELVSVRDVIQEMAVQLMSDSDNAIKRALVHKDLGKLCHFFGRQRASDVLLSHMITFLNDKTDYQLRATFYKCVPDLAEFVGWQSSLILQPLIQQGLRDFEEMVIHAAIVCSSELAKRSVLKKPIVYEVCSDVMPMLCHPNRWIRNAVVNFLTVLSGELSLPDLYTKVIPSALPYLKYELIKLEPANVVLQSLRDPIPREVFDLVAKSNDVKPLLEFLSEKQMMRQLSRSVTSGINCSLPDDPQLSTLYQKLLNRGLTPEFEDRIIAFRDILLKMHKLRISISGELSPISSRPGVIDLSYHLGIKRQDIEVSKYSSHTKGIPLSAAAGIQNEEWQAMFGTTAIDSASASSIPASSSASVTSSSNLSTGLGPPLPMTPAGGHDIDPVLESSPDSNRISDEPIIADLMASGGSSTFDGSSSASDRASSDLGGKFSVIDPQLSQSIQNATQEAAGFVISDCQVEQQQFLEWKLEEVMRAQKPPSTAIDDPHSFPTCGWKPSGSLVAHVHEHRGPVNRLALHPNGCVFASCSSDGTVKLWDCQRMEGKSMANRSRTTYSAQGGKLKSVQFTEDGNSLASASDNCSVQLLKVDGTRLLEARTYRTDPESQGPPVCMDAFSQGNYGIITVLTHHGNVISWDTRQADPIWKFRNNYRYGLATAMCLDVNGTNWVTIGTDSGQLITWDIRFQLEINTTHHPSYRRVFGLWSHPLYHNSVIASFTGNGEVSVWDLESSSRTFVLWSGEKALLSYQECDESFTSAVYWNRDRKYPFVITGDSKSAIRFWNLSNVKRSGLVSVRGLDSRHHNYIYKTQIIDGVEVLSESVTNRRTMGSGSGSSGRSLGSGSNDITQGKSPLETTPTLAHHDIVSDITLGHTGQWFLISASRDGVIKVWK